MQILCQALTAAGYKYWRREDLGGDDELTKVSARAPCNHFLFWFPSFAWGLHAALGKEDGKIVVLFRVLIVPVPFLSADYILVHLPFVHGAPGFFSPEKPQTGWSLEADPTQMSYCTASVAILKNLSLSLSLMSSDVLRHCSWFQSASDHELNLLEWS